MTAATVEPAPVRDDVEAVIAQLRNHVYESDHYYAVRAQDPAKRLDVLLELAAGVTPELPGAPR